MCMSRARGEVLEAALPRTTQGSEHKVEYSQPGGPKAPPHLPAQGHHSQHQSASISRTLDPEDRDESSRQEASLDSLSGLPSTFF